MHAGLPYRNLIELTAMIDGVHRNQTYFCRSLFSIRCKLSEVTIKFRSIYSP